MNNNAFRLSILILLLIPQKITLSQDFKFGAFIDAIFSLQHKEVVSDIYVNFPFGNQPTSEIDLFVEGQSLESILSNNLDYFSENGFTRVSFTVIEGNGLYFFQSPLLNGALHEDFNYDSQLQDPNNPQSELISGMDDLTALKRYAFGVDLAGFFVKEAQKRGMTTELNIEALAHIINRANARGVGGSSNEVVIADNLPPLTPDEVGLLIEQLYSSVLAYDSSITTFTIYEEAFDNEYVQVIDETTTRLNLTHRRAGPSINGYGDEWAAYYYSFYPLTVLQEQIYRYLITLASTPAVEAITTGAARAAGKKAQITVGHYTPWPNDLSMGIEELWDRESDVPINANQPLVATRTSGLQTNYVLFSLIAEHANEFFIATDLDSAIQDFLNLSIQQKWLPLLQEFSYVLNEERPKINIIIDYATDNGNDLAEGNIITDFSEQMPYVVQFSMLEPIMATVLAAGFEPWVSYNHPIQTRNDIEAYWIITAGGDELIEADGIAESPPLWTQGDDLSDDLLSLLDSSKTPEPVFVSIMSGLPNTGNWLKVRDFFSIPPGRGGTENGLHYSSSNLISSEDYQTSFATNILNNADGEPYENELGQLLTAQVLPDTIEWEGNAVRMNGLEPAQFGIFLNMISPNEIPRENNVISSVRSDGSDSVRINQLEFIDGPIQTETIPGVFMIKNGSDGNKFLITPNTYHIDMAYPLSNILCDATGIDRTLNAPVTAYIAGGKTKAVFAIENTTVDLNVPSSEVRIDRFDPRGEWVVKNQVENTSSVFPMEINRHELIIFTPMDTADINNWALF